jgi:hypothetical protein
MCHWLTRVLVSVSLIAAGLAINSYKEPPCFNNLGKCRDDLGRKAVETLKDKYVLMIGDSLTRYQYTSLVYTLRHRYPPLPSMYPDMNEFTHDGWNAFFKESNDMLAPYEQCDCSYYSGRFFEHRRYHDPHMNISVTYIMYRGFFIEGSSDTNSLRAPEPQEAHAPKWSTGMENYLLNVFRPKKVDYLITNVGFFEFHESIIPAKYLQWCQTLSDRVIWKTTTAVQHETIAKPNEQRPRFNRVDEEMCGTKHVHCLDTSWTVKVDSEKDYFDSIHFREPVYTMLNDQLIDLIRGMHGGASATEEGANPATKPARRALRQHYSNITRS